MNTKIRSRTAFPRMLEETLFKAYQEGKRSVDFLLLFPVTEQERDQIILQAKSYSVVSEKDKDQIIAQTKAHSVVLDAKWRFGTVLFTAYIRH